MCCSRPTPWTKWRRIAVCGSVGGPGCGRRATLAPNGHHRGSQSHHFGSRGGVGPDHPQLVSLLPSRQIFAALLSVWSIISRSRATSDSQGNAAECRGRPGDAVQGWNTRQAPLPASRHSAWGIPQLICIHFRNLAIAPAGNILAILSSESRSGARAVAPRPNGFHPRSQAPCYFNKAAGVTGLSRNPLMPASLKSCPNRWVELAVNATMGVFPLLPVRERIM